MIYSVFQAIAVVSALAFLYYTQLLIRQLMLVRNFKGPLALPWVGNCYSVEAMYTLRFFSKLRKRYGKIFTFFMFQKLYIVLCEPAAVRRVLSDPKTFPKGDEYRERFSVAFGDGLITSNGEKHKHDRALFGRFFVRANLIKFLTTVNMLAREATASVQAKDGKPKVHNIEEYFATLALRTFALFSLNIDYRSRPDREKEICHMVSKGSLGVAQAILLNFLPMWNIFPPVAAAVKVRHELWKDVKPVLLQRKADAAAGKEVPDDCLGAMIAENMPEQDMIDHVVTLLAAGHDTTAYFSSYFCYLLGQYPEEQEKLRDEIISVMGDREEVTNEDIQNMKYMSKCMQEVLRLYAIAPNITRYASEDVHIKELDITIPKGVGVFIPMFLINRDPDLWEDPSTFNPDRFEGKGNEFTSAKNGFFPFGYGSRTCIGNVLAQLESAIFLSHLLRKFKIVADPGFKPNIMSGISLTTSNGINVILEELR